MGLMQIIKEEKQKFKEMGAEAYTKNLVNNEEIYGQIPEKYKEKILAMSKDASVLVGEKTTTLSPLEAAIHGFVKGSICGIGASYRRKKQR